MSVFPIFAKSFITKEGSVPSKNLFKSILGEIIFIVKFNGVFDVLLCLFKTRLPKNKFDIIKVTVNKTVNIFSLFVCSNKMTAGTKKKVKTIKLKEYVPMYDSIWIN